ncbi:hypothetical protein CANCADRAFT_76352 [Tortispora caseinolytica NRRL Y-17796]|uniref:acetyl-CoA C-acetyltransferase n=1 Tax=Tortispora caseinolytica NRRL Y-17796 TaxID=767744 RepID=A0A1E4TJA4_9ASCO|nr:hypothetical protein CANCADRAFT_76352 [Tortispora caseinolytica NRRL Y-17796]
MQIRSATNSAKRAFHTSHPAHLIGNAVYVVSGARTPVGKFNSALKSKTATDLGAIAVKAAVERSKIPIDKFDEAYIGNVISANIGQAPARQAVLKAGLPVETEATTINKVCASGMKALTIGSQSIQTGIAGVVIAGGMESMSNVPFYFPRGASYGNQTANDGILRDGLIDVYDDIHMGLCGENTNKTYGITREEQDEFAIESYRRANESLKTGVFKEEIVPVEIKSRKGTIIVDTDEEPAQTTLEKIAGLRPVFAKDGTITAANASPLNDGASALVLASAEKVKEFGTPVLGRILGYADAATKPIDFTIAPSMAVPLALERAGLTINDISLFEFNEAFSCVGIVNTRLLKLDPAKVNIHGGAVALGHPIGSSGSRIVVTLLHALKEGQYGVAAICNGGGAATAVVVQKVSSI